MKKVVALLFLTFTCGSCAAEDTVLSIEGGWLFPRFYINGERQQPKLFRNGECFRLLDTNEASSAHYSKYKRYHTICVLLPLAVSVTAKTSDEVLERFPFTLVLVAGLSWFNHRHLVRATDAYNQSAVSLTYGITENDLVFDTLSNGIRCITGRPITLRNTMSHCRINNHP